MERRYYRLTKTYFFCVCWLWTLVLDFESSESKGLHEQVLIDNISPHCRLVVKHCGHFRGSLRVLLLCLIFLIHICCLEEPTQGLKESHDLGLAQYVRKDLEITAEFGEAIKV